MSDRYGPTICQLIGEPYNHVRINDCARCTMKTCPIYVILKKLGELNPQATPWPKETGVKHPPKPEGRPPCFGNMHLLSEADMAERCLPCRIFNECKKLSPSAVDDIDATTAANVIPRQPDTDREYDTKW